MFRVLAATVPIDTVPPLPAWIPTADAPVPPWMVVADVDSRLPIVKFVVLLAVALLPQPIVCAIPIAMLPIWNVLELLALALLLFMVAAL